MDRLAEKPQPLYIDTQPLGWEENALPMFRKYTMGRSPNQLGIQQFNRWIERTGEHPSQSHFTVIVPIHNERRVLPSFLSTLRMSDIPGRVSMQVIFVTNACKDASPLIVDGFLRSLNNFEEVDVGLDPIHPGIDRVATWASSARHNYLHINTDVPGKANALTIGNKLALAREDRIAICIDADTYPEPDALRNLYAASVDKMVRNPDGTVLLSGIGNEVWRSTRLLRFWQKIRPKQELYKLGPVNGSLMAWRTDWIDRLGEVPPVANEDYAMSVVARLQGYKTGRVLDAPNWYYGPNNIRDVYQSRARLRRCVLQILAHYPGSEEIMRADGNMPLLTERISPFVALALKRPWFSPMYVAKTLLNEAARIKGYQDFKKNPSNMSWVPIASTK